MDQDQLEFLQRLAAARGLPAPSAAPVARRVAGADGVALNCLDWGGDGPPLLLLHGGALTARTWDLVCCALTARARCLALDLRGHGDSGWSEDYRIEASAQDVVAVCGELGLRRPHLVGMSLGGCVAGHAAARLGEAAASLTFVDVGAEVDFEASAGLRDFMGRIEAVARIEDLVARALAVSPQTDPDLMLYRYRTLMRPAPEGFVLKQDRRQPPDFPHILARLAELSELAPGLAGPVLVVRGARSRILTDPAAAAFAARFPRGRWAVVPDAGHNVQEDNPAALAALLTGQLGL